MRWSMALKRGGCAVAVGCAAALLAVAIGWSAGGVQAEAAAAPAERSVERVMAHVEALAGEIGSRTADGPGAAEAADYIRGELGALGLPFEEAPLGWVEIPAGEVFEREVLPALRLHFSDPNILVRLGPEGAAGDAILLMAHYDTVLGSPGAIDNAVGVGILLELAGALSEAPPDRPVVLAFTAAEEVRLAGAEVLAPKLADEVGLAVSIDLVGGGGQLALNGLSELIGAAWLRWLSDAARRADVDARAPLPHRVISRKVPALERSDHGPFTRAGVPALHLYHRGEGNVLPAYHTAFDTPAIVDRASVDEAARLAAAIAYAEGELPPRGGDPGMWLPLPGGVIVPGALVLAVEAALALVAALGLAAAWLRGRRRAVAPPPRTGLLLVLLGYTAAVAAVAGAFYVDAQLRAHPMPWIHAPGRYLLAAALLGAAAALLWWRWRRARPLAGELRYLAPAVGLTGGAGAAALALGAFELAWLPLWSAAALGAMGLTRSRVARLVLLCAALAPLAAAFAPAFLRELFFHGFWPRALPLAAYVGAMALPFALGAALLAPARPGADTPAPAPRVSGRALALAALVCAAAALALLAATTPPCDGEAFARQGLACELQSR